MTETTSGRDVEKFLRQLWQLETTLVRSGLPAMPPWWRREIERFYRSGKRRWVIRKGRRVFASTCVAPRLAVAEMLYGQHQHLAGMPPLVFAFLSVKKDEASKRLRGVTAILDVLREPYDASGDTIELLRRPAIFAVVTANFRTNVGDTVAFAWLDEVSRWLDSDLSSNPAEQVVGSLAPALATLPDAKLILVSTPLGSEDYHARQFDLGETEQQCVSFGTTWTINPALTRERCEAIEPDAKLFQREYAAQPQRTLTEALDGDSVALAGRDWPSLIFQEPVLAIDASGGGACEFASAVVVYGDPQQAGAPIDLALSPPRDADGNDLSPFFELRADGRMELNDHGQPIRKAHLSQERGPILTVSHVDGFTNWRGTMGLEDIVTELTAKMDEFGIGIACGDGYEGQGLEALFRERGYRFVGIPTAAGNKTDAIRRLRMLLSGRQVLIDDETTRAQLLSYRERISPSGYIQYAPAAGARSDRVSVIVNGLIAEAGGHLPWSPLWVGKRGRLSAPDEIYG